MKKLTHATMPVREERVSPALQAELTRLGFLPAFLDFATMEIHACRQPDGHPARRHLYDGLPDSAIAIRSPCGRVMAIKATLVAGFERGGFFYTCAAAARAAREWAGTVAD